MKNIRAKLGAVLLLALVSTTGCGDKMITLTDAEESIIVNYAAHVVAKYNTRQPDGLAGLSNTSLDEIAGTDSTKEEEQEEQAENTLGEMTQEEEQNVTDGQAVETTGEEIPTGEETRQVTLSEALGIAGADATVTGIELRDSFVEQDYFAMDATAGKTFLVVNVSLTNMTDQDVVCDMLSQKPQFKAYVNGGNAVPAETTILLNDISTYQGTIPVGGRVDTVLLFMVPKDQVGQVDSLVLDVDVNGVANEVVCQ